MGWVELDIGIAPKLIGVAKSYLVAVANVPKYSVDSHHVFKPKIVQHIGGLSPTISGLFSPVLSQF